MLTLVLPLLVLLACISCATKGGSQPRRLPSNLYVLPFEGDEIGDPEAFRRVIELIYAQGAWPDCAAYLTLEEFFEGNRDADSFAVNLGRDAPYAEPAGWFAALRTVREFDAVRTMLVAICDVETYEDGRIANWPYSDTVILLTREPREEVLGWCEGLAFDDVFALDPASYEDLDRWLVARGLERISNGEKAWVVWWD